MLMIFSSDRISLNYKRDAKSPLNFERDLILSKTEPAYVSCPFDFHVSLTYYRC